MLTVTEAYALLAVGVVLVVVVIVVVSQSLRRYRLRRLEELRGSGSAPGGGSDRAYNRLALARREADLLAAQGGDVERASQLIALADRSLQTREFDRAYDLAQAAHETLVRARREPRRGHPLATNPAVGAVAPAATPSEGGTAPSAEAGAAGASSVAKNRAEAQFQLRLFDQDLAAASKGGTNRAGVKEARNLYVQAHAAFARADYAEAFRLALRGRRRVGGRVESLAPPPSGPAPPQGAQGTAALGDAAQAAEEVAALDRCPLCGHPTAANDAFCRGCGAARTPSVCPKCGASRQPTDTFCGRCGERYDRAAA